jgi:amino acid adenylation domain-containing protein
MSSALLNQNNVAAVPARESISGRFARVAERHAKRTALSTPDGEWTYAELDERSNALAAHLLDRAGKSSAPIALLMEHGAPLVAAILAVLKTGRIYTALEPGDPASRLAAMRANAGAGILVTDNANAALARSLAAEGVQVVLAAENFKIATRVDLPQIPPDTGAWLMYTSGSTGAPKGVWQDHHGVVEQIDLNCEFSQLTFEDRLPLLTSCSLAASASPLFAALLNGAALCPFHLRSQGVERLAVWLQQERISIYHSVSTVFRHVAQAAGTRAFESARVVRLGGEAVLRSDVELFKRYCPANSRLMNVYTSTETGLITGIMIDKQFPLPDWRVSVGPPVRGVEVTLLDERDQPVPRGAEGRIAVRTDHMARGYWQQPEATAAAFQRDSAGSEVRTFVTGDLGRWLPDGTLEHLGRVDQVVKINGRRIDPNEVEAALRATGLVNETAVVTADDEESERRLVAYVVPREGAEATPNEYRRSLRTHLPEYLIPAEFISLPLLPQTSGGKLDRLALPKPQRRRAPKAVSRYRNMPRDRVEGKLARIWQEVLDLPEIGRDEDFFDLGGTSLQSSQVMTRVEATFNVALPLSTLAEHSTIEQLAMLLADRTIIRSTTALVTMRAADSGRPLFLVHDGKGDISVYGQLARRLPGRPIYGLQSLGLHAEGWPIMNISAMARRYVNEIVGADPTGPYLLAATCMGGLVAFEIAQQLVKAGRPVGLLAMIDTPAPPFSGRRPYWHEFMLDPVRDWFRILYWSAVRSVGLGRTAPWLPSYRHFVSGMNNRARRAYRPSTYSGNITLMLTEDARRFKTDRRRMMSRFVRETRTFMVPGDRIGLFAPPAVDEVARQLQACMESAVAESSLATGTQVERAQ